LLSTGQLGTVFGITERSLASETLTESFGGLKITSPSRLCIG